MNFSKTEKKYQFFITSFMVILCSSFIFALIYVFGMSLATRAELIENYYFVIIPKNPTIEAYRRIFTNNAFYTSLSISVMRCIIAPTLSVIVSFICAYMLSQRDMPGIKFMTIFIIFTMLFGAGLIPTYLLYSQLNLINNFLVYVIPGLVNVWGALAMKVFIENIPKSLIESAEMDGSSPFSTMTRIVLPLSLPSMIAIFMFLLVAHWNSWYDAFIFVKNPILKPLQLYLRSLLLINNGVESLTPIDIGSAIDNETIKMAAIIVSSLPMLMIFPFLQKYFIHGVFSGSVKE